MGHYGTVTIYDHQHIFTVRWNQQNHVWLACYPIRCFQLSLPKGLMQDFTEIGGKKIDQAEDIKAGFSSCGLNIYLFYLTWHIHIIYNHIYIYEIVHMNISKGAFGDLFCQEKLKQVDSDRSKQPCTQEAQGFTKHVQRCTQSCSLSGLYLSCMSCACEHAQLHA